MKLYCGVDLHANNRVVSITDEKIVGFNVPSQRPSEYWRRIHQSGRMGAPEWPT